MFSFSIIYYREYCIQYAGYSYSNQKYSTSRYLKQVLRKLGRVFQSFPCLFGLRTCIAHKTVFLRDIQHMERKVDHSEVYWPDRVA